MRKKLFCILPFLIFFICITSISTAYEPVKRLTAIEIYHAMLYFPIGGNIAEVYQRLGRPIFDNERLTVYEHNRTKDPLLLGKTPFNTIETAMIIEKCKSIEDMNARHMLITEQFKRRFGPPFFEGETGVYWKIDSLIVSIISSPSGGDFSPAVVYQSSPQAPTR